MFIYIYRYWYYAHCIWFPFRPLFTGFLDFQLRKVIVGCPRNPARTSKNDVSVLAKWPIVSVIPFHLVDQNTQNGLHIGFMWICCETSSWMGKTMAKYGIFKKESIANHMTRSTPSGLDPTGWPKGSTCVPFSGKRLPSCKRLHSYWTSPFLITINGHFQ